MPDPTEPLEDTEDEDETIIDDDDGLLDADVDDMRDHARDDVLSLELPPS